MNEGENFIIMKKNIQILKLLGIYIGFDKNVVVKPNKIKVYVFVGIIASILLLQVWTAFNKFTVLEASNSLAIISSVFCFLGKYILMYYHRVEFWNLMTSLQREYKQSKWVNKSLPTAPSMA